MRKLGAAPLPLRAAQARDTLFLVPDVLSLDDLVLPDTRSLPSFVPPPRFEGTRFGSYRPQEPSQARACEVTRDFVTASPTAPGGFRWPWHRQKVEGKRGLYLDGGFGVGKTHLLAAAYHAFEKTEKAYLSFQELVYVIGVKGMAGAEEAMGGLRLVCVDEFELDDPGNTLIVKTFLEKLFEGGSRVITTSNTPPEGQGQGRFNAEDFQREIQSVAARFRTVRVEGPDFRQRDHLATFYSGEALLALQKERAREPKTVLEWPQLLDLLGRYHPIRYRELLENVGTLFVHGVRTIPTQNDALRFVHFIDKLYDLKKGFRASGEVALDALFDPSYRDSAYAKKHERCLSRLTELLEEPL